MLPEELRQYVALLKRRFLQWRDPPVDLPPDSVIEDVLRDIIEQHELARRE